MTPVRLDRLLDWLYQLDFDATPVLEERARLLLLDTLGCFISAQSHPEMQELARTCACIHSGEIRLPAVEGEFSLSAAVNLLATGSFWDEACEGLARAHGRPGLHVFPNVVAIGLSRNLSLAKVLRALVRGYEFGARMGEKLRVRPGMHVDGTWGALGATMAAADALDLDIDSCRQAIGIAACQIPTSLYLPVARGSRARNSYTAHASQLGLLSTVSAMSGMDAPDQAVESYYEVALGGDREDLLFQESDEFMILQGYLKQFAAARHVHYGAQCAMDLRRSPDWPEATSAITALKLCTYPEAMTYCYHRAPQRAVQAQFSLSYGVAHSLVVGSLNSEAYTAEALREPETVRLESLIEIEIDPILEVSGSRGAELTVQVSQQSLSTRVERIMGDSGFEIESDLIRDKFIDSARVALGRSAAVELAARILTGSASTGFRGILGL